MQNNYIKILRNLDFFNFKNIPLFSVTDITAFGACKLIFSLSNIRSI